MTALFLNKRKRSCDAVSDTGTCSHTEQTEASTPRREADVKTQLLAQKREEHAEQKLQLEEQIKQAQEQKQHVALQLEQLEGCECSRDMLGISDLRAQMQAYEQQEEQAQQQLAKLGKQFEAAVADILGIPAEQQAGQLAQAVQEQQQLQEATVQQLVIEQQLARPEFAVTDSSKHQAKRARLDRMSQVWDWLQGQSSSVHAVADGEGPADAAHAQQQQQQLDGLQQQSDVPATKHQQQPQQHQCAAAEQLQPPQSHQDQQQQQGEEEDKFAEGC